MEVATLKRKRRLLFLMVAFGLPAALFVIPVLVFRHRYQVDHALITAVKRNDTRGVSNLLGQGADANVHEQTMRGLSVWRLIWDRLRGSPVGTQGPTPLLLALEPVGHRAYLPENLPLVTMLLDHGAKIDVQDPGGWTPLDLAIFSGKNATIHLLLQRGASVRPHPVKSARGYVEAPIVNACLGNAASVEEVADLLDHGAKVNEQDGAGETPIFTAVTRNRADVVRLLLARHADVSIPDKYGHTVLRYVRRFHNAPAVQEISTLVEQAAAQRPHP